MSENPANEALAAGTRLLSHREHSAAELRRKLDQRGFDADTIDTTLAELTELGLVDDSRFGEHWVRSRRSRGFGPLKIRAELRQRGVDDGVSGRVLAAADGWVSLAHDWLVTHGGLPDPDDRDERARAYRRLCRRGFTHEQAMKALGKQA